jgi:hypothetical protein
VTRKEVRVAHLPATSDEMYRDREEINMTTVGVAIVGVVVIDTKMSLDASLNMSTNRLNVRSDDYQY